MKDANGTSGNETGKADAARQGRHGEISMQEKFFRGTGAMIACLVVAVAFAFPLASCVKASGGGKGAVASPETAGGSAGNASDESGRRAEPRFSIAPSGDSGDISGFVPGSSIVLRFDQYSGMPLAVSDGKGKKVNVVSKKIPWAMSVSAAAVSASMGRAAIAVNRMGILFVEIVPESIGALTQTGKSVADSAAGSMGEGKVASRVAWATVYDKALFGNRTIGAFWNSGGRYRVFLYSNEAFSAGTAAPGIYSLGEGEKSWRSDGIPAAPGETAGWVADYLAPASGGDLVMQYHRGAEATREALYARLSKGSGYDGDIASFAKVAGRMKRITQDEFLALARPGGKSKMKKEVASLCDAGKLRSIYRGQDEHVESMAVYAIARSSSFAEERSFLVDGAEDAEWSATLSVWGWPADEAKKAEAGGDFDATVAAEARQGPVVLYPDGSVVSKDFSAAFPHAGDKREYRFLTVAARTGESATVGGDLVVASWAEEVFPDVGEAGISLLMTRAR